MLNRRRILKIFEESEAILNGHFRLTSGLHSKKYLQCAQVLQYPNHVKLLCEEIAKNFKKEKPTVVAGPAIGGIIVSYEVARSLGCRSIFAERQDGKMLFRRNFSISKSDRVLVVEDVVTTGLSTNELIKLVKETGATLAGVGCIIDRSSSKVDFGAKFKSLIKIKVDTYKPGNCPMCLKNIPAIKPGSRR